MQCWRCTARYHKCSTVMSCQLQFLRRPAAPCKYTDLQTQCLQADSTHQHAPVFSAYGCKTCCCNVDTFRQLSFQTTPTHTDQEHLEVAAYILYAVNAALASTAQPPPLGCPRETPRCSHYSGMPRQALQVCNDCHRKARALSSASAAAAPPAAPPTARHPT